MTGRRQPALGGPWLVRPPVGDRPKLLFCLPFAGAGVSMYRNWPRSIGEFELCPVQLPGRENRIGEADFENSRGTCRRRGGGLAADA